MREVDLWYLDISMDTMASQDTCSPTSRVTTFPLPIRLARRYLPYSTGTDVRKVDRMANMAEQGEHPLTPPYLSLAATKVTYWHSI